MARKLEAGDIICLSGELGSGKTVLTKGIAQGLGIKKERVISPSFVLIRQYELNTRLPLYHFDLYRLKECRDILEIGYEEYLFGKGVTVIEWAEKLNFLLPKECLKIKLLVKDRTSRQLKFSALGRRYKKLLRDIYANLGH